MMSLKKRRKIRRVACELVHTAASDEGGLSLKSVLAATAEIRGLKRISIKVASLETGRLACAHVVDDIARISVTPGCATLQHTLAHELGHLVLGHKGIPGVEVDLDLSSCPPGLEALHRKMLPAYFSRQEQMQSEWEAEFFASEFLTILPGAGRPRAVSELIYGLA